MSNLEMLVVNENGQMEIDFEALEMITNSDFVEYIKRDLETDKGFIEAFEILDLTNGGGIPFVHVFVVTSGICKRFSFEDGKIKRLVINPSSVKIFARLLGGAINE